MSGRPCPDERRRKRPRRQQWLGHVKKTRPNHAPAFQAPAVLAPLESDKTLPALAKQYGFQQNRITGWKRQLTERSVPPIGEASAWLRCIWADKRSLALFGVFDHDIKLTHNSPLVCECFKASEGCGGVVLGQLYDLPLPSQSLRQRLRPGAGNVVTTKLM